MKGFTLVEVMIVMFILLMIAGLGVRQYLGVLEDARRKNTLTYVKTLAGAVELYQLAVGRPPTVEQGLNALLVCPADVDRNKWTGPYLNDTAKTNDEWGHPYQYNTPSTHGNGMFDVWSWGPDGIDGTDDDIGQWTKE